MDDDQVLRAKVELMKTQLSQLAPMAVAVARLDATVQGLNGRVEHSLKQASHVAASAVETLERQQRRNDKTHEDLIARLDHIAHLHVDRFERVLRANVVAVGEAFEGHRRDVHEPEARRLRLVLPVAYAIAGTGTVGGAVWLGLQIATKLQGG